jgi:parvulin-like peptidyl-prolyl isomerase
VQHLLVQYRGAARSTKSQSRTKEEAKKLAEELHKKALAGEDFSQLSIDHSDSPEAKDRRGSLGKIRKGDMDKTFEAAAFKLKVGEISPVIETRFGFHVIKRNQ